MTFIPKDLNLVRNNILLNLVENVDEINDTNVGSALDMFTVALAYEIVQQYDSMNVIYKGFNINTSTGDDLNNLGDLIGVERIAGNNATGEVSFIRNQPASSNFQISSGTGVSTQPSANSAVYSFTTTEDVTFTTSNNVSRTFKDGVYEYKLLNKRFENVTIDINGSAFTNFTINTDYKSKIIDTTTYEEINTCESNSGWTALTGAATLTTNSTYKIQGSNSLNLIKTSTATDTFGYVNGFTNKDLDGKSLMVSLRTTSSFLTNKFESLTIKMGSGYNNGSGNTNNNYEWTVTDTNSFTAGDFTRFFFDISNATTNNAPNIKEIDFVQISMTVQNNSDTVSADDFVMDLWFASKYDNYNGYALVIDDTTKPTTDDVMDITYSPLSVEASATADNIGTSSNVGVGRITYITTNIANVDSVYNYDAFINGTALENDSDYRNRIITGAYVNATSSANAIVQNVKALSYVDDCLVIDMPEKTENDEAHVYNDTKKEFTLDFFKAKDDSTLLISNTIGGTADYIKDTDYELTADNKINWDIGGTNPTDGNTVYVDYNYDSVGNFTVVVVGSEGVLTNTQVNEITTLVDDIKSPGTIATISQATYVQTDVGATLTINSSYSTTIVKSNVTTAINDYITSLEIGQDVRLSRIIDVVMDVEGVTDIDTVTINSNANNLTISSTQKAVPQTITLN